VKADKAVLWKHWAKIPAKMFETAEVRALIDGALVAGDGGASLVRPDTTLRAMILLGVNCAFDNTPTVRNSGNRS